MTYEIALTDKARDFYKFTSPAIAKKLARCFSTLEQNPCHWTLDKNEAKKIGIK